ncbi:para-aminobenzoate synthase, component I [Novosphingobium nitrogenifigens DSM 19370]|uniref:Probable branched-chain-amino-acid aminotransferase n=1 Tax=Novosphingobium nitrogenifigens DSM 19370 TaxID=983920 RepID=F1ZCL6_9SPHN|nr:aminodeoxychorismate synthase component I [Novosphingobium nitrogenifigens]EGD57647.1 para-aminobenzoate synthase, component I [Novosphingobium nitrogenifigens DSM 19370]
MTRPFFILLDDARRDGAVPSRLYETPLETVVARRPEEVVPALARIGAVPGHWAGYVAYEAGLALEPRLEGLAPARTGASGPLVWFTRFADLTLMNDADVETWLAMQAEGEGRLGPMTPDLSTGGYARAFAGVEEAIRAGDTYQVNLTFPLGGTWRGDPLAIHAQLRRDARAGYGAVIWDGSHWHLSHSPELFFRLDAGDATVRPMKGTAPRGRTEEEDRVNRETLAANVKDRAENLMIVDLMRNDLARRAVPGSVKVEAPFAIESYPTVHQMVTTVHARLLPGEGAADLVRAIFPCGSVTGAPKIRAMELIDTHERDARGLYCGAIGHVDPAGDAVFNVAIRSLRLAPDHPGADGGRATMGVGSAVVADSVALGEWRECMIKGNFLQLSAGQADLIETMAFDPAKGIALLEFHLERLRDSASALAFAFDRHAARNAIHALCFDLDAPARVRLVVSRGGAMALETAPLPAPIEGALVCAVLPLPVSADDWRLRHKSSDRGFYEAALAAARAAGAGEALFLRDDGLVTEGSFTNVFVRRSDGRLVTPRADLGLLPGVLRRSLIDADKVVEGEVRLADLADGFLVGNALRGLVPARLLEL